MANAPGSPTKTIGDQIYLVDYNAWQSIIADVKVNWYGVPTYSSQIPSGEIAKAEEWIKLRQDIDDCIMHQTGALSVISNSTSTAITTSTNISASTFSLFASEVTRAYTNRADIDELTQYQSHPNVATSTRAYPWGDNVIGNNVIRHEVQVNFFSAQHATFFFNQGGRLTFRATTAPGPVTTAKDTAWATLLAGVGTRFYTRDHWNIGGTQIIAKRIYEVSSAEKSSGSFGTWVYNDQITPTAYTNSEFIGDWKGGRGGWVSTPGLSHTDANKPIAYQPNVAFGGSISVYPGAYKENFYRVFATKNSDTQLTFTIEFNDFTGINSVNKQFIDESVNLRITSAVGYDTSEVTDGIGILGIGNLLGSPNSLTIQNISNL